MKKAISTSVLAVVAYLSMVISGIWSVVQFILYLVKDRPFNWWSVYIIIISFVVLIASSILTAYFGIKENE